MIKISSGKKKIKRILALPGAAATGRNWRRKEDNRDGSVSGLIAFGNLITFGTSCYWFNI